jgi:hypothetical protein
VRVMLTLPDREEISRGLAEGLLYKEIGSGSLSVVTLCHVLVRVL